MNRFALAAAALLLSSTPLLAQESETDRLKKEVDRLKFENQALVEKLSRFEDPKAREGAWSHRDLLKELVELEKKHVEMARERKLLEDRLKAVPGPVPAPVVTPAAPEAKAARSLMESLTPSQAPPTFYGSFKTAVKGKVSAVAGEIGLVVLSVGRDAGVAEGDEFSITRDGREIAKVTVDRLDQKWSAGKVIQKKEDVRVADDAARVAQVPQFWTSVPRTSKVVVAGRAPSDEVQSLRKELDEVRAQVRQLSDRLVPSYQGPGVSAEEVSEELRTHLGILRGLLIRRVREGSAAAKAGLQANDVVPDLLEAQLVEALESGMPVPIIRQGTRTRLPGAKGR
jgi:hypothetical protein